MIFLITQCGRAESVLMRRPVPALVASSFNSGDPPRSFARRQVASRQNNVPVHKGQREPFRVSDSPESLFLQPPTF